MEDLELQKELSKNKIDKFIINEEIEEYKSKIASNILNGEGNEIRSFYLSKPIVKKIKKPIRVKINEFFNKLKIVFLGYD